MGWFLLGCVPHCCTVSDSIQDIGTGEELGLFFSGVNASCLACCLFLRHRGRFPWWGGFRTPRYHGPPGCLLRKRRAADGPSHPAVIIPLKLCSLGDCFLSRCSWVFNWLVVRVSWSLGLKCCLVWCPLRPAPLFALVFVVLSFFSGCLVGFVDAVLSLSLSLSFFLSQALGKPKPLSGVWDSPCVSSSRTRTSPSTRSSPCSSSPRSCPAPVVFFFSSSLAGMVVVGLGLSGLGVSVLRLVGWFFVVACLVALHARHHLGRI